MVLPRDSVSGDPDLPYDDTGVYVVGAALASLSTGPAIVTAMIMGADGTRRTVEQLSEVGF
jgi:hypothetical protein